MNAKKRAKNKAYYEWYKSHGICVCCHSKDAVPGMVRCADCAYKQQMRNIAVNKEHERERGRRRREAAIASGLCVVCGQPADSGHTMCGRCRQKQAKRSRERRVRSTRHSEGKCLSCDMPLVPGYYYCDEHLKFRREVAAKARETIKKRKEERAANGTQAVTDSADQLRNHASLPRGNGRA